MSQAGDVMLKHGLCILILQTITISCFAATCSLAVQGVNFGTYNPTATQESELNGVVTLRCDTNASGQISLGSGQSHHMLDRQLHDGANHYLHYNLYYNLAAREVWGNGNEGTVQWDFQVAPNQATSKEVFGMVPAGQYVNPGAYSDLVTVTMDIN